MKQVLLITDGFIHPPYLGRIALHKILKSIDGIAFDHTRSLEKRARDFENFSALVVYIHQVEISEKALDALNSFVSNGGGVLAIHSATASFKDTPRFTDILGGRFIGHGPVKPFIITPVSPENEIFDGIPEFRVTDELYLHDQQPDIEIHFTALHEGERIPMVWTRNHGNGRICYTCPGHRAVAFRIPEYQEVLIRGLKWVCKMVFLPSAGQPWQTMNQGK